MPDGYAEYRCEFSCRAISSFGCEEVSQSNVPPRKQINLNGTRSQAVMTLCQLLPGPLKQQINLTNYYFKTEDKLDHSHSLFVC